ERNREPEPGTGTRTRNRTGTRTQNPEQRTGTTGYREAIMSEKHPQSSDPPKSLIDIVRQVRQRWRMKLVLRGAVSVLATVVLLTLVAAYGLEWARFSGASIVAARILIVLAILASVAYFLVRPLMQRVTDD